MFLFFDFPFIVHQNSLNVGSLACHLLPHCTPGWFLKVQQGRGLRFKELKKIEKHNFFEALSWGIKPTLIRFYLWNRTTPYPIHMYFFISFCMSWVLFAQQNLSFYNHMRWIILSSVSVNWLGILLIKKIEKLINRKTYLLFFLIKWIVCIKLVFPFGNWS